VILPLLLAAAASLAFDGIALGDDAAAIAATHAGHSTFTALGPAFTWRREGGGTMMIAGDARGKVAVVDFAADQGEEGTIALPQAGSFDLQASHVALEKALGEPALSECAPNYSGGYCGAFALSGETEIVVQFESNGGQLHRATWATPAILSKLQLIAPTIAPTQ
jgi:hypothetical protein